MRPPGARAAKLQVPAAAAAIPIAAAPVAAASDAAAAIAAAPIAAAVAYGQGPGPGHLCMRGPDAMRARCPRERFVPLHHRVRR